MKYYQDDLITIYHGNSEEILPSLDFDCICTDPPYGIDLNTKRASTQQGRVGRFARGASRLAVCEDFPPVAGDDKPFDPAWLIGFNKPTLLWGANHFADKLPASAGWIVWDKLRPDTADQTVAELAWTNFVKGVRVFRHLWNGMIRASEQGLHLHPTQKPVALCTWLIAGRWFPKGTIADPYMGAGSMLVAAKLAGIKAIGIELEEPYCERAAKRLTQGTFNFGGI